MSKPTTNGSPFRSITDLKDFNDDEVYDLKKEPSLTDPSQDESIETLVARMMRGEIVLGQQAPRYDFENVVDHNAAFAAMPPSQREGFDIADIPGLVNQADTALRGMNITPPPAVPPAPVQTPAPVPADLKQ